MKILIAASVAVVIGIASFMAFHGAEDTTRSAEAGLFDHLKQDWMSNPYWFEGKAEINLYQSTLIKYGKPRLTDDIVHILVTENHRSDKLIKADDQEAPGLVHMLKFNYLTNVQTGIYPYHQMMSIFFDQQDSRIAKMTFSSQEWCGNSFKEVVNFQGRSSFSYNTYWDGQGQGQFNVSFPSDLVLYDSLPLQLRMIDLEPGLSTTLRLLPGQISSQVKNPQLETALLSVSEPADFSVPAGTFRAYPLRVRHSGGEDRLWFEADFPNRMLRWETFDQNTFELRKSERLAYWELNQPGDEVYLQ